jgi:hypothetical protein
MVFLFLVFFIVILSSTTANPMPIPAPPDYNQIALYGLFLVLTFIVYTFLEYIVIFGYLKKIVKAGFKARNRLYTVIISINFVTFPIIILMAILFKPLFYLYLNITTIEYILLESVPITLETLFFLWAFNFLHKKGYLGRPVSKRKTFFATLMANILSFIFGFFISPFYVVLYPSPYFYSSDITLFVSFLTLGLSFVFILLFLSFILFLVSHIELV